MTHNYIPQKKPSQTNHHLIISSSHPSTHQTSLILSYNFRPPSNSTVPQCLRSSFGISETETKTEAPEAAEDLLPKVQLRTGQSFYKATPTWRIVPGLVSG